MKAAACFILVLALLTVICYISAVSSRIIAVKVSSALGIEKVRDQAQVNEDVQRFRDIQAKNVKDNGNSNGIEKAANAIALKSIARQK